MEEDDIRFDCFKRGDGYYFCHGIHIPTGITSKPHDGRSYMKIKQEIIEDIKAKMANIKNSKED